MVFPSCGKVLVIDDNIEEAMPLIRLLGDRGVSSLYYSGKATELPAEPLNSVRLVFCDLKFNAAPDGKSVVSNIVNILKHLISAENGPYILLIWSMHETDYLEELKATIAGEIASPEFILPLSKSDYFSSWAEGEALSKEMLQEIEKVGLESMDYQKVREIVETKTMDFLPLRKEPVEGAIQKIGDKLSEELKKVSLFHLFVLWENTINGSALQTVNSIFKEIPDGISNDKKLQAMLFFLSYYHLEKQMDEADPEQKLFAALKSLNEMFSYFCDENVKKIELKDIGIEDVVKCDGVEVPSFAKFNRWMWIAASVMTGAPGTVYMDGEKRFDYHGWVSPDLHKTIKAKSREERERIRLDNKKKYDKNIADLVAKQEIRYILVDISADCDYAQKKQYVAKMIPGIMMPYNEYEDCKEKEIIKGKSGSAPDYMILFKRVEIEEKEWVVAFNLNQLFYIDISEIGGLEAQFSFSPTALTYLKQHASACIAKQGIAAF